MKIKAQLHRLFYSFVWLVPVIILLDFFSKMGMERWLKTEGNSVEVIPNFFYFTLHYNRDIAFSIRIFNGQMWAYALVSAIGAALMIGYLILKRKTAPLWMKICVYLMLGGCLGNFIDRAFYGSRGVIDFLDFYPFGYDFAVFNIADSMLVCGVLAMAILMFIIDYQEGKIKKQVKSEQGEMVETTTHSEYEE